jgi:hypothetical protein
MQPIKLFENFLLLFKWNTLTWQVLNSSENQGVTATPLPLPPPPQKQHKEVKPYVSQSADASAANTDSKMAALHAYPMARGLCKFCAEKMLRGTDVHLQSNYMQFRRSGNCFRVDQILSWCMTIHTEKINSICCYPKRLWLLHGHQKLKFWS